MPPPEPIPAPIPQHSSQHRSVVSILCGEHRPPGMETVEAAAQVRYATADTLQAVLPGSEALFVWDFLNPALAQAWHAADALQWVHVASAGVDAVLTPQLRDSAVTLTNSRAVFDGPLAEFVLTQILNFAKDVPTTLAAQRQHRWQHRETEPIADRSALVVGTGPIGRAIARLLRAVGMDVAGLGRRAIAHDPDFGTVHAFDALPARLAEADYVIAVAPLTEQTRGMFCRETLAAMRPEARLINVGRGDLVVTADLVNALRTGTISGAALDVFDVEPLPADSPLWQMDNVLISPHMSGDFRGWLDTLAHRFVQNFHRWNSGQALHNVVDKRLGYVPSDTSIQTGNVEGAG